MINIPNNTTPGVTRTPTENNQRRKDSPSESLPNSPENPQRTLKAGFIERRKNGDRRQQQRKILIDTRKKRDRRRTGRLDIEV
ncbi:hypothetical protein GYB62_01155 [bacterium]|nr:hypothetical protein [bacterium]